MNKASHDLITISVDNLVSVTGGMILVDGKCIAGCSKQEKQSPAGGVTAEEIWADQLKKKR